MGRKGPRAKTKTVMKSVSQWAKFGTMQNLKFQTLPHKNHPNMACNGGRIINILGEERLRFYRLSALCSNHYEGLRHQSRRQNIKEGGFDFVYIYTSSILATFVQLCSNFSWVEQNFNHTSSVRTLPETRLQKLQS